MQIGNGLHFFIIFAEESLLRVSGICMDSVSQPMPPPQDRDCHEWVQFISPTVIIFVLALAILRWGQDVLTAYRREKENFLQLNGNVVKFQMPVAHAVAA